MKKLFVLFSVISSISFSALAQEIITEKELVKFDTGNTFEECIENCRYYHRSELNLPHGHGQGICWEKCYEKHVKPSDDTNKE